MAAYLNLTNYHTLTIESGQIVHKGSSIDKIDDGDMSFSLVKAVKSTFGAREVPKLRFKDFVDYMTASKKLNQLFLKKMDLKGEEINYFSRGLAENRSIEMLQIDFHLTDSEDASDSILERLVFVVKAHPTLKNVSFRFSNSSFDRPKNYSQAIEQLVTSRHLKEIELYNLSNDCLSRLGQALSQNKGTIEALHLNYSQPSIRTDINTFFQAFLTNTTVKVLGISRLLFKNIQFLNSLENSSCLERFIAHSCGFSKKQLKEMASKLPRELSFETDDYYASSMQCDLDGFVYTKLTDLEKQEIQNLRQEAPSRLSRQSPREEATRHTDYGTFRLTSTPRASTSRASSSL